MPTRKRLDAYDCALARTVDVVGDPWSMLILRDAAIGARRFGEFEASLGMAKNILASRLRKLVGAGLMSVEVGDYKLTEAGWALLPALVALMQWGDRWMFAGRPPVQVCSPSGEPVEPVTLRAGSEPVRPEELRYRPTPAATPRTAAFLDQLASRRGASDA